MIRYSLHFKLGSIHFNDIANIFKSVRESSSIKINLTLTAHSATLFEVGLHNMKRWPQIIFKKAMHSVEKISDFTVDSS